MLQRLDRLECNCMTFVDNFFTNKNNYLYYRHAKK